MTRRVVAAAGVTVAALFLYLATLLPGVDFGDTPSFQVMAGDASISPRDAYPLYFAIGDGLLWLRGGDHAHALNLVSAIEAALAGGVFVLLAAELSGSILAAVAAGWLFATSYTFWSQSIIAEVYALHVLLIALTLLALLSWASRPTTGRLTVFFAVYAVSFGNHLMMILLLPAYALFILVTAPGGWRGLVQARTVALATLVPAIASLQYLWNLRDLWLRRVPPPTLLDGLRTFWFDITKADWRDTLILALPRSMFGERARMYAFDLQQQFGWAGPFLALAGFIWLARASRARAMLLLIAFAVTFGFAFSYSVGDSHVFFLPSHFFVALAAACGVASLGVMVGRWLHYPAAGSTASVVLLAFAAYRAYDNFPALDRSDDGRPVDRLAQLTRDLDDRRDILLVDLNWQVQNGLTYFASEMTHAVAYRRLADVLLYAPALVRDNRAIGRSVVLSEQANDRLTEAYGPAFSTEVDARTATEPFSAVIARLPRGTRYVLAVLKPTRDTQLDRADVQAALSFLTGGTGRLPQQDYFAIAGVVGRQASFLRAANVPFREDIVLDSTPVTVRMDAWLAFDTIRRMGFGHVIVGRQHTLILERGVSFAAFDATGRPSTRVYAAGIFAPAPRYRITRAMVEP